MSPRRSPQPRGVAIAGTGMAVPPRILTNDDLEKIVETSDEWITKRTGIKTRRIVDPGTTARDLAREALTHALSRAAVEAGDLDLILLATLLPDMACPSSAAQIAHEIGATPAGAMDLSAACSGFVYGLNLASSLIETGRYRTVAVVGAETLTAVTDWSDRRTCILFGDGAGAVILTATDDPEQGCLAQSMHSDGSRWPDLYLPRTEHHLPDSHDGFSGNFNTIQMNGREVFKFAVSTTQRMIDEVLTEAGIGPDDLTMIIPHQSNKRILDATRQRLGLPAAKLYINIDRYGNTSAASVAICLHELTASGRIKGGDLVLFIAVGGGMTWSSSLWRL